MIRTNHLALVFLLSFPVCVGSAAPEQSSAPPATRQVALTEQEIEAQIRRAMERGREQQTGAPRNRAATPETPERAPEDVSDKGELFVPRVESHAEFTAFHFTGVLAHAQVYDVVVASRSVWIGTTHGLVRHDVADGSWRLIKPPPASGARGVPRIVATDRGLAVQLWDYPTRGYANPKGAYWYDPASGHWKQIRPGDFVQPVYWDGSRLWLRNGAEYYRFDLSSAKYDILGKPRNVEFAMDSLSRLSTNGYEAFLCGHGRNDPKTKTWHGGGLAIVHLLSYNWRHYVRRDGMSDDYCSDLHVTDTEVWTAHWDEAKGLSRFDRRTYQWEKVTQALNGIDIGGPHLTRDGDTLWIGQQRGLVRLDRRTLIAQRFAEADGLPGYIVSGLAVGDDFVWVGAYAYGDQSFHGVKSSGVVRLSRTPAQPGSR